MTLPLRLAILAMLCLGPAVPAAAQEGSGGSAKVEEAQTCRSQGKKLCIGVRSHSRPFSYHSDRMIDVATHATLGPLGRERYTGYVVKICDAVLTEMISDDPGLTIDDIGVFDIDAARVAATRAANAAVQHSGLNIQAGDVRFANLGEEFDILCDPATITNERRVDFFLSPPIYLTGISYITPANATPPHNGCSPFTALIGLVGRTTAQSYGLSALIDAQELPSYKDDLIKVQRGVPACASVENPYEKLEMTRLKQSAGKGEASDTPAGAQERSPVLVFDTHDEAAEAFCDRKFHYYLGDREIIREQAGAIPGCDFDGGVETYTEDRYAIFGKAMESVAMRAEPTRAVLRPAGSGGKPALDTTDATMASDSVLRVAAGVSVDKDRRLRVATFFEILARKTLSYPSLLDQAYEETFQDTPKSDKLKTFFRNVRGTPRNR